MTHQFENHLYYSTPFHLLKPCLRVSISFENVVTIPSVGLSFYMPFMIFKQTVGIFWIFWNSRHFFLTWIFKIILSKHIK